MILHARIARWRECAAKGADLKYTDLSHEQLVNLLVKRDAQSKLGLVWERRDHLPDSAMNADFVTMNLADSDSCAGGAPYRNLIIEGDNYDALRWLRVTHTGRIKVIYIDPPYNTGNKDWVYNDDFGCPDDRYPQSTWLEWLYQRLMLARDLLTEDGVVLVSISDDNRSKLDLLMEEVFPGMRKGSFVWRSRIGGNDAGDCYFSVNHEHVLVYGGPKFRFGGNRKALAHYSNSDNDPRGDWFADNLTVSVKYTDKRAGNAYYPLHDPKTGIWYPCNPNGVWRFGSKQFLKKGQKLKKASMEDLIADNKVIFPVGERTAVWNTMDELLDAIDRRDVPFRGGVPVLRQGLPNLEFWVGKTVGWGSPKYRRHKSELKSEFSPVSSWVRTKVDEHGAEVGLIELSSLMGEEGTTLLNKMFGEKVFDYPKPLSLMTDLLKQVASDGDIVLDFFAGSGTTGHALLALNAEDGDDRRFILVSSREKTGEDPNRNLCRDVCAARIRKVIGGFNGTEGLGGDFAYLRAERIALEDIAYDFTPEQIWVSILAMHDLPIVPLDTGRVVNAAITDDRVAVAYCNKFTQEAEDMLRRLAADHSVFVYTWTPGLVVDAFRGSNSIEVRAVPDEFMKRFHA